jgi:hypothetical protein
MPIWTTSLSSATAPGTTSTFALNWRTGQTTTVSVSFGGSSTTTNTVAVQYTLDDPMRVSSSLIQWLPLSSGLFTAPSTALFFLSAGTNFDNGYTAALSAPIGGIRFNSTTFGSTGGLGTATMKVMQGEGT